MQKAFYLEQISFHEPAPGWVDGVYYPRTAQVSEAKCESLVSFGTPRVAEAQVECDEVKEISVEFGAEPLQLQSRVWREIEETGFGIYYYEETTRIVTKLSGNNYRVRLLLVNPGTESYKCHVRVNGIVKVSCAEVAPGAEAAVSFTACMTDGQFALTVAIGDMAEVDETVREGTVYLKELEIEPEQQRSRREIPRVFLVSDSTVQSYERLFYPQTGWGQMLHQFFAGDEEYREYPAEHCDYAQGRTYELPGLVIENRSIGGRSAKSFYEEGKLDQILEIICPGDYMFVQFAHNDSTAIRPNRYITAEDFPSFLQIYADACEKRDVQLVFVTPVTMRVLQEDGTNQLCFAEYREQMIKLAHEKKIPLLDLSKRSNDYLNEIGYEESKNLYLWLEKGDYPDGPYAEGVSDKCHLQEYGAKVYANMVSQMIAEYAADGRLDGLKALAKPVPVEEIPKPATAQRNAMDGAENTDAVTGFVVQEISVDGGRGSFLLNWNPVAGAVSYHIYGKREKELTYEVVRTVSKEEKEKFAVLPFAAQAGILWQYYVTAVFQNGSEGRASRVQEVDLRA